MQTELQDTTAGKLFPFMLLHSSCFAKKNSLGRQSKLVGTISLIAHSSASVMSSLDNANSADGSFSGGCLLAKT